MVCSNLLCSYFCLRLSLWFVPQKKRGRAQPVPSSDGTCFIPSLIRNV